MGATNSLEREEGIKERGLLIGDPGQPAHQGVFYNCGIECTPYDRFL
jgi:hypothetical protein